VELGGVNIAGRAVNSEGSFISCTPIFFDGCSVFPLAHTNGENPAVRVDTAESRRIHREKRGVYMRLYNRGFASQQFEKIIRKRHG